MGLKDPKIVVLALMQTKWFLFGNMFRIIALQKKNENLWQNLKYRMPQHLNLKWRRVVALVFVKKHVFKTN